MTYLIVLKLLQQHRLFYNWSKIIYENINYQGSFVCIS